MQVGDEAHGITGRNIERVGNRWQEKNGRHDHVNSLTFAKGSSILDINRPDSFWPNYDQSTRL